MREEHAALTAGGVRVVAVSPDDPAEATVLAAELGLSFPILSDPERRVVSRFGVATADDVLPSAFLLDRRGRVQWAKVGGDPSDQPSPRDAVAAVRGAAPLPIPSPSDVLTPVVSAAVAAIFALLAVLAAVADRHLLPWDESLREAIRDFGGQPFHTIMSWVSRLGSRWLIGALTVPAVLVAWRRCRQLAVVLVAAFAGALVLELALKVVVDRPRPPLAQGFGDSFPSGHVLAAVAFWGLVPPWTYLVTRRRWAWAATAAVSAAVIAGVGVSRVELGAHWPSDVVGGYLGGAVFLLVAEWALRRPSKALHCEACDLHPLRGRLTGR